MQGNTGTTGTTRPHWGRWIVMAVAATVLAVGLAFTLTRAGASEGPNHQRVVVETDGEALHLLGGLSYAGFVGFEPAGSTGTVERVMRVNEEPDVVASEINRTLGPTITAWVEDVD